MLVRRRRQCVSCGYRFTTQEQVVGQGSFHTKRPKREGPVVCSAEGCQMQLSQFTASDRCSRHQEEFAR